MSRNEDRLPNNAVQSADSPLVPSLEYAVPTEFIDLPSKGAFYPKDHPLHECDQIEIKYMTSKEEDILTSKSLLRKGIAVDRLLQSIVVNKKIDIDSLLIGDKNALVIAARITGYGADYLTSITCPACNERAKFEFDLTKANTNDANLEELGVLTTPNNTILIDLPVTKWRVEAKVMTGADEKWLGKLAENKKKHKLGEATLSDQAKRLIISISGVYDVGAIAEAIDAMPALDSKHFRTVYQKAIPNVNLTQTFVCDKCDTEQEVQVPITADFFWPE
jgi:hypothetical protein